ncbi:hypothetical protein MSAN_00424600 [Mycena sanguinolenta]|uniref:G-protein coupled receptors family 2 profile 2 domain-containing protein n=1 Tax=Mycena sanguinolenta TaxID=230812 RepID=A0A8H7DLA4_9AGAR|nr:hypothetical protein MSAN_00424600 [Mycena sanguinolenta]
MTPALSLYPCNPQTPGLSLKIRPLCGQTFCILLCGWTPLRPTMSFPLNSRSLSSDAHTCAQIILGLIIPGMVLTVILLILCGCAAWNSVSRRYLDRVSFRLLIYALGAHLVFGVAFTFSSLMANPGWRCNLMAFLNNISLMFSAGMFFCMALNLPLVLAYNCNGQRMEKYYVFCTMAVSSICNILPWNAANDTCWYLGPKPTIRLHWLVGTQTIWILLSAVGEVGAFFNCCWLSHRVETRRFCGRTDAPSRNTSSQSSHRPGLTIATFRNIILRVGLYPFVSCLLNISTAALDLYEVRLPQSSEIPRILNLTDLAIYAGRPLIYGLLAATDPSLIRALRALRHPEAESQTKSLDQSRNAWWPAQTGCLSTVVDMPPEDVHEDVIGLDKIDRRGGTSTISGLGTDVEEGKERPLDEKRDQGTTTNAISLDVVCHI